MGLCQPRSRPRSPLRKRILEAFHRPPALRVGHDPPVFPPHRRPPPVALPPQTAARVTLTTAAVPMASPDTLQEAAHGASPGYDDDDGDDHAARPSKKRRQTGLSEPADRPQRRQAACQPCRLRKIKCDKRRPSCSICSSSGVSCEYIESNVVKLTLESATESLLERLDGLQHSLDRLKYENLTSNHHLPLPRDDSLHSNISPTTSPPFSADAPLLEPSKDFLQIPPHRASADTVLTWDVFEAKYPINALTGVLFEPDANAARDPASSASVDGFSAGLLNPPDDERIPALIDNFLQNVHTKNPILDVESLVMYSRRCAEHGVGWDAWSCLVLLACALGSVAKPFGSAAPTSPLLRAESGELAHAPLPNSSQMFATELRQADACFVLACRRIGSLKPSMIAAQCQFLAGGTWRRPF